jgi:hypothetical protein
MKEKTKKQQAESNIIHAASSSMAERDRARDMLAARYGIKSAFVRVGCLAEVLGMAEPTIYAHMRTGAFFMPFRRLNSTPVVKLDDLVEWYCAHDGSGGGDRRRDATIADSDFDRSKIEAAEPEKVRRALEREQKERMIARALSKMNDGLSKPHRKK